MSKATPRNPLKIEDLYGLTSPRRYQREYERFLMATYFATGAREYDSSNARPPGSADDFGMAYVNRYLAFDEEAVYFMPSMDACYRDWLRGLDYSEWGI